MNTARAALLLCTVFVLAGCASLPNSLANWWGKNKPEVKLEVPAATEAEKTSTTGAAESTVATEKTEVEVVASNPDDALALSTVSNMIVKNSPGVSALGLGMASITARLHSAETDGKMLYTKYDAYNFPASDGTNAICYFFYERDGKVIGGKFDFWRVGGRGSKTLDNVHEGYGGHSMPAKGTKAWTMISSKDGKQRSNVVAVTWR